jgi:hypothetical protein
VDFDETASKGDLMKRVALLLAVLLVATPTAAIANGDDDDVFFLRGTAMRALDPENSKNEVVSLTSVFPGPPAQFGSLVRFFRRGVKVPDLDNQLEAKVWFPTLPAQGGPTNCGVGSPRMQLAIDRDGDGDFDGNLFGAVGPFPAFAACPQNTWIYEDFTGPDTILGMAGAQGISPPQPGSPPNEQGEWDTSQLGGVAFGVTWSGVEAFMTATHPNHRVCSASLVHDFGAPPGKMYADIVSAGDATFNEHEDIAGRAPSGDPCRIDDDDDDD